MDEITESTVDSGMQEFMSTMTGSDYQTDAEPESTESTQDTVSESDETQKSADESENQTTENKDSQEPTEEAKEEPQMFTVKVNKEEKQLTLDEMTAAAQKGMDYDRIRSQRDQLQEELSGAKQKASEYEKLSNVIDQLNAVARTTGVPLEELALKFRKGIKRSEGLSDAEIEATIRAEDSEFALKSMQEQSAAPEKSEAEQRMERDINEFHAVYPDVELTDELVHELSDDIQSGMSLASAYQKSENAKRSAEMTALQKKNEELEAKLKAEEQNRKNFYQSPGSQADNGGKTQLTGMDEFMALAMK